MKNGMYGIACPFCSHSPDAMTFNEPAELPQVINYYMSHCIIYHWNELEAYKNMNNDLASGASVNLVESDS